MTTKVIVGLGNPGQKYEMTRHNMGYLVVKAMARQLGWSFKEEHRFKAFVAKGMVERTAVKVDLKGIGERKEVTEELEKQAIALHLLLPTTYMNCSGIAVRSYLDFFKLPLSSLIVVMDDLSLPLGRMRLRSKGSSGGHNGLKSIQSHLGSDEIVRLRMGIGKICGDHLKIDGTKKRGSSLLEVAGHELVDYVLGSFSAEEALCLEKFIEAGAQVLDRLLTDSVANVMNVVNKKE
jgi:PTH1 family peptidyl-tRNA hydrolase